jgi:hypothetical protein
METVGQDGVGINSLGQCGSGQASISALGASSCTFADVNADHSSAR